MKKLILLVLLTMPVVSGAWDVHSDSITIATFVMYPYEGIPYPEKWTYSAYVPCDGCDADSIPFKREYHAFGDFQGVRFIHSGNRDTVFDGSIIWMGPGEIETPDTFLTGQYDDMDSALAPPPLSVQYYTGYGGYPAADADRVIDAVRKHAFLKQLPAYRIGIFLYTPVIGPVDPSASRWIVFAYQGAAVSGITNNSRAGYSGVLHNAGTVYSVTGSVAPAGIGRNGIYLQFDSGGVLRKRMVLE